MSCKCSVAAVETEFRWSDRFLCETGRIYPERPDIVSGYAPLYSSHGNCLHLIELEIALYIQPGYYSILAANCWLALQKKNWLITYQDLDCDNMRWLVISLSSPLCAKCSLEMQRTQTVDYSTHYTLVTHAHQLQIRGYSSNLLLQKFKGEKVSVHFACTSCTSI